MKKIFLVLLFAFSLFAGESEEIGVSYIEKNGGELDSAVLAPDGKSFYTLKGDLVTQWQLNPIQKLMSFKKTAKEFPDTQTYNIHITSDQSKMVIHSHEEIELWDLRSKQRINQVKAKTAWGLMDESVFITIDENRHINKWDTNSLKKILNKQLPDPCRSSTIDRCSSRPHFMIFSNNTLAYVSMDYVVFLDKNSLNIIESIEKVHFGVAMSLDRQFLYFEFDRENFPDFYKPMEEQSKIWEVEIDSVQKRQVSVEYILGNPRSWTTKYFYPKYMNYWDSKTSSSCQTLSLVHTRYLPTNPFPGGRYYGYGFFNNKTNQPLATFFQYEDGEWILIDPKGFYEASPNIKEHLKFKKQPKLEKVYGSDTLRLRYPSGFDLSEKNYHYYNKKIILKAD